MFQSIIVIFWMEYLHENIDYMIFQNLLKMVNNYSSEMSSNLNVLPSSENSLLY